MASATLPIFSVNSPGLTQSDDFSSQMRQSYSLRNLEFVSLRVIPNPLEGRQRQLGASTESDISVTVPQA
jgi:hypothetical protein